jgi:hypothetical protein
VFLIPRVDHGVEVATLREARDETRRGLEVERAGRAADRAAEAALVSAREVHTVRLEAAAEIAASLREQLADVRRDRDADRARLAADRPEPKSARGPGA